MSFWKISAQGAPPVLAGPGEIEVQETFTGNLVLAGRPTIVKVRIGVGPAFWGDRFREAAGRPEEPINPRPL
ncbi:MAG: hypothetical protein AAGN35_01250 [Bacteroidota bacterium]